MGRMEDSTVEQCEVLCGDYPFYSLQVRARST